MGEKVGSLRYFIDLFSGAGGLSEGFVQQGFIPVAHVEVDKDAAATLRTRAAYHYLSSNNNIKPYTDYLNCKIDRETLYSFIPSREMETIINQRLEDESIDQICQTIDNAMAQIGASKIDVLVGGPPCQTFSVISRRKDNQPFNNPNDQRNRLYILYSIVLMRYTPEYFVFENVPGFITAKNGEFFNNFKSQVENAGYDVSAEVFDACEYGALQKRQRLIIIGRRKDTCSKVVHIENLKPSNAVVWELLKDLTPLVPGEENNKYISAPTSYTYTSGVRNDERIPLTLHTCRYHNEIDRSIYHEAIALWNNSKLRLHYDNLNRSLITRTKIDSFRDKYKVVAGDLPFSHTVIAHIAKDGHYYIHPDIRQIRSLSVREAARIQSFPDNFFFEGARLKKFTQIGNAVPPIMAEQIARGIRRALENG